MRIAILFTGHFLHGGDDIIRTKALCVDLLVQATAPLLDRTNALKLGRQLALQQVSTETGAKTRLLGDRLDNENEGSRAVVADRILVDDVQGRLVDQSDIETCLLQALDGIERSVQHVTV